MEETFGLREGEKSLAIHTILLRGLNTEALLYMYAITLTILLRSE